MIIQHSFPFAASLSKGRSLLKKKGRAAPRAAFEQPELVLSLSDRLPDREARR